MTRRELAWAALFQALLWAILVLAIHVAWRPFAG